MADMKTATEHDPTFYLRGEKSPTPLKLEPIMRSQTLTDSIVPSSINSNPLYDLANDQPVSAFKYPRIVVKDAYGRVLDTFTALQDAIYRASWTMKKMGEWPKTPLEWRLPKAPVPSKPDFSRAGPRSMTSLQNDQEHHHGLTSCRQDITSTSRRLEFTTDALVNIPTVEIAVDDVAFVAESLNHLPNIPSFSFLRHSILAGQATYIQIVASILLHQKQLTATEHRTAEWEFPGFCSGCKRAGFCYGCSKNPKPHVHEDTPAMIGGGFRFWKRDRPRDPHDWKHPGNWGLPTSEEELRNVIEQNGGLLAYEQAVRKSRRQMLIDRNSMDMQEVSTQGDNFSQDLRLRELSNQSPYSPYVTVASTDISEKDTNEEEKENEDNISELEKTISEIQDKEGKQKKVSINETITRSHSSNSLVASEESLDTTLVQVDTGYFEGIVDEDTKGEGQSDSKTDDNQAEDKGERGKREMNVDICS